MTCYVDISSFYLLMSVASKVVHSEPKSGTNVLSGLPQKRAGVTKDTRPSLLLLTTESHQVPLVT